MLRILLVCLLVIPGAVLAQSVNTTLTGSWTGGGTVHLKPTSKQQRTSCNAIFDQQSGFWLRGAVSCKKGRRMDRVELRFSEPNRKGDLIMNIVDRDGDPIVQFEGSVTGSEITLYHPDVLTFSGTGYRPVLRIDTADGNLRFSQIGVPTRSNASQYLMSDLLFQRSGNN